jgi:hypothetical protein
VFFYNTGWYGFVTLKRLQRNKVTWLQQPASHVIWVLCFTRKQKTQTGLFFPTQRMLSLESNIDRVAQVPHSEGGVLARCPSLKRKEPILGVIRPRRVVEGGFATAQEDAETEGLDMVEEKGVRRLT